MSTPYNMHTNSDAVAIRFDKVSKKFTLHPERARSFQELALNLLQRNHHRAPEEFWALRDVSFTVKRGETLGIIGPNGAGKSTLLKLISRIIEPTSGRIEINGRVGALLELGAGFHPDLTGRENVYLNGSILGLTHAQIRRKLDEIVAFAELERFIDVPVKHYSSGMYVRLGFSVAAHTDPEILLIDEVLAVGDQNFQHKCLEHVLEMQRRGVTICFVSHDLASIRRLCSAAIWLGEGVVRAAGNVDDTISAYLRYAAEEEEARMEAPTPVLTEVERIPVIALESHPLEIVKLSLRGVNGTEHTVFRVGEVWQASLHYRAYQRIENPVIKLTVHRDDGLHVCTAITSIPSIEGEGEICYRVERLPLLEGRYLLSAVVYDQTATQSYAQCDGLYKVRQTGRGERYGLMSLGGEWIWDGPATALPKAPYAQAISKTSGRRWGSGDVEITAVSFFDAAGMERRVFESGEAWGVRLYYHAPRRVERPVFGMAIHRNDGVHVCGPNTYFYGLEIPFVEGEGAISYRVPALPLLEGTYLVSVSSHNEADTVMYDFHDRLYPFKVSQFSTDSEPRGVVELGGRWEQTPWRP
ncbi:MAG: ABC transporter ATP-binding protein [Anaerolineae bacterium]|nr:ABC transporter ATP-binding protein [Anaerolineae bacterium]